VFERGGGSDRWTINSSELMFEAPWFCANRVS
jgi:hypothetical protein